MKGISQADVLGAMAAVAALKRPHNAGHEVSDAFWDGFDAAIDAAGEALLTAFLTEPEDRRIADRRSVELPNLTRFTEPTFRKDEFGYDLND